MQCMICARPCIKFGMLSITMHETRSKREMYEVHSIQCVKCMHAQHADS